MTKKRLMLIILDGFGEGKPEPINAIYAAKTPFIDRLKADYPWSLLEPGGASVGVLPDQTGGSDVGHNTIGSGQIARQPIKIIYDAVEDGSFFENKKLLAAIRHAKKHNSNLHLFGIGSNSYIHAYLPYLYALLDLCEKENFSGDRVLLHLAGDGRDNPPDSGLEFFTEIETECKKRGIGRIASVFGRFYLDRGGNWDRTKKVYDLLTDKQQAYVTDWKSIFQKTYKQNRSDEMIEPIAIGDENGIFPRITENDAVINFNYRADRERQITATFASDFDKFERKNVLKNVYYVGFISYASDLKDAHHAFEEEQSDLCLAEILEQNGYTQLHAAGQEKIIFVTYNFNRCKTLEEIELQGEAHETAPQTKQVETFDHNPEMSAPNLSKALVNHLEKDEYDIYVVNYENCDQVGHTGNLEAAIKAVEAVDQGLSQVIPKALEKGFDVLITADHGNADIMVDENGKPHTAHTHNKVPFFYISEKKKQTSVKDGFLYDIAPTVLNLLGIKKPEAMIGQSLVS